MFLYIAVFCAFLGFGYYFWLGYKHRKTFFVNILNFCEHLNIEISFSKSTIRAIIDKYGATYGRHFRTILLGYQKLLDEKQDVTRDKIDLLLIRPKLKPSERSTILDFLYDLGRHGVTEEKEKIASKRKQFDIFFSEASMALKREASIYLKISIILGIAAVVLML